MGRADSTISRELRRNAIVPRGEPQNIAISAALTCSLTMRNRIVIGSCAIKP
ncbi:hypothetical protein [Rhodanobacter thiooxydans]|uniref:hypothetical protein n=1 Tax=Rhodanobacter thiooxydans TaxID=416169 RepID=UPI003CCC97C7